MKKLSLLLLLVAAGCGKATVTQQSAAAACLTASACGIVDTTFIRGVTGCAQLAATINEPATAAAFKLTPAQVNCIAAAGSDCAAAKRCLANGNTPQSCSGVSASCAGTTWQGCGPEAGINGSNGVRLFDCASSNLMCVTSNNTTDCGYDTCSPNGASCSTDGTYVRHCDNGIEHREDCASINATCNPSGFLGAHCRGNGAPCQGSGTLRCDGSVLVSCSDGQESRYDCSRVNLGCTTKSGGGFGCLAGSDCDPATYQAMCTGTKLTFCNKGLIDTADCGAAGFTGCNANNGGACTK
jgi:hypothetical protein